MCTSAKIAAKTNTCWLGSVKARLKLGAQNIHDSLKELKDEL
jgi:hypothetical protein